MLLEYKGFKENWCCEEAEVITWSNIFVGDIVEKFKDTEDELKRNAEIEKEIREKIYEETHFEDIFFLIGNTPINFLNNICVVCLQNKEKSKTYVFEQGFGVYMLNNSGKTVQKLT